MLTMRSSAHPLSPLFHTLPFPSSPPPPASPPPSLPSHVTQGMSRSSCMRRLAKRLMAAAPGKQYRGLPPASSQEGKWGMGGRGGGGSMEQEPESPSPLTPLPPIPPRPPLTMLANSPLLLAWPHHPLTAHESERAPAPFHRPLFLAGIKASRDSPQRSLPSSRKVGIMGKSAMACLRSYFSISPR